MTTKVEAARQALATHDALRAVRETEPECDPDTGLPYNRVAWLDWRVTESSPAYERWQRAMSELAQVLDEPGMSRHPANFRPICEAILAAEEV